LATMADIDELIRVRSALNDELAPHTDAQRTQFADHFRAWLPGRIESGQFIAVMGFIGTDLVSTAFLLVNDRPATLSIPNGRIATLVNVYTVPAYRRRGLGQHRSRTRDQCRGTRSHHRRARGVREFGLRGARTPPDAADLVRTRPETQRQCVYSM